MAYLNKNQHFPFPEKYPSPEVIELSLLSVQCCLPHLEKGDAVDFHVSWFQQG